MGKGEQAAKKKPGSKKTPAKKQKLSEDDLGRVSGGREQAQKAPLHSVEADRKNVR
jgi:hypothetical protein